MKTTFRLQQIQRQIAKIKGELLELGDLHPGSLSRQYNVCGKPGCRCKDPKNPRRHGPYHKVSYVYRGRFHLAVRLRAIRSKKSGPNWPTTSASETDR